MRLTSVFIFAVVLLLNAVPALAGSGSSNGVPEPSSMALLGTGLAVVAAYRLRRWKR